MLEFDFGDPENDLITAMHFNFNINPVLMIQQQKLQPNSPGMPGDIHTYILQKMLLDTQCEYYWRIDTSSQTTAPVVGDEKGTTANSDS